VYRLYHVAEDLVMMSVLTETKSTVSYSFVKMSIVTMIGVLFPLAPPIIAGFIWTMQQN